MVPVDILNPGTDWMTRRMSDRVLRTLNSDVSDMTVTRPEAHSIPAVVLTIALVTVRSYLEPPEHTSDQDHATWQQLRSDHQ